MMGLTPQMAKALAFLKSYSAARGVMPSLDEIRAEIGQASKSGAHRVLTALEERGYIRRMAGKQRAIELIEAPELSRLSSPELTKLAIGAVAELQRRGVTLAIDGGVAA